MFRLTKSFWYLACVFLISIATLGVSVRSYYRDFKIQDLGQNNLISNLGFFLLINFNIILVMVLGYLVIKNIVKLVLERRKKILGTKLRTRLVLAFIALSMVPTILLFGISVGILESVLQGWFSPQVVSALDSSLSVAKLYYNDSQKRIKRDAETLSFHLEKLLGNVDAFDSSLLNEFLEQKRNELDYFEISVYKKDGDLIASAVDTRVLDGTIDLMGANKFALIKAEKLGTIVRPEQSLNGEFLRGYSFLNFEILPQLHSSQLDYNDGLKNLTNDQYVIVISKWFNRELSGVFARLIDAQDNYNELRAYRRPLASSYLLTLAVVTLLVIFAAIWVGFYLARGISVPIQLLAEGTEEIAHGNLTHRIPEVGDDELSFLVKSFNRMTGDLNETTSELITRRRYIEVLVQSLSIGVLSISPEHKLLTINNSAKSILGIGDNSIGQALEDIVPRDFASELLPLISELVSSTAQIKSKELKANIGVIDKHLQVSLTKLLDADNKLLGIVILLDDLSELISAQRMAAWREVAKRIAHEIKNPLTPIQLSAQRLKRKFSSGQSQISFEEKKLIEESTDMIVSQVENLRVLVNEFSRFARMPKVVLKPNDINVLIREVVNVFKNSNQDIDFKLELFESLPSLSLDKEQFSRVLINLIDNSVASINSYKEQKSDTQRGSILVKTKLNSDLGFVKISVCDTGSGISDGDKPKIFEPYFSTKKEGTGLGLAIVSSIVADHEGFLRIFDNSPHGAIFTIELPIKTR